MIVKKLFEKASSKASENSFPGPPFPQPQPEPQPQPPVIEATAPSSIPFRSNLACVTLNRHDTIRFLNFPFSDVQIFRDTIIRSWPKGIYGLTQYGVAWEVKLHGGPWQSIHTGIDLPKVLVKELLATMYDRGWVLYTAVEYIKKSWGKDAMIFRYQSPPPPPCDWLSISFDRYDRLKVIGPPPPEVASALLQTFTPFLERHSFTATSLELKFNSRPWTPYGLETVDSSRILLMLLEVFEANGYTVYTSLHQTQRNEGVGTDVMIMHRQKGWAPGMPVWHR